MIGLECNPLRLYGNQESWFIRRLSLIGCVARPLSQRIDLSESTSGNTESAIRLQRSYLTTFLIWCDLNRLASCAPDGALGRV